MVFLIPDDLPDGTGSGVGLTAQQMIDDAHALAMLAAPCLGEEPSVLTPGQVDAAKAILRGAIMRWDDAGSGALSSQTAGPFGQQLDTRTPRRSMFYPSEIAQLRDVCGGTSPSGAFSIDTTPAGFGIVHADICSINFGALYCSCGAVLTQGLPLYENL